MHLISSAVVLKSIALADSQIPNNAYINIITVKWCVQITVITISAKVLAHRSRVMRKPAFGICENKDADQLRGNRKADQRPCFSLQG